MTVLAAPPRPRAPVSAVPGWVMPVAVVLVAAVAAGHAAAIAPHYHVGSFDDDGHYLAAAQGLVHGLGYVDTSAPGAPLETLIPPGYPALLAPLLWLSGGALWPLRALSAVAFVACVPLLDVLMARHGFGRGVRVAALLVFALNPVGATFATMLMPETVFLAILLAVLVAVPRWRGRGWSWAGAVVAVGTPWLLLLKAAGLAIVAGIVVWLLVQRRWRHALVTCGTSALLLGPVAVSRLLSPGSLVGDRYASDYGDGGHPLDAIWHYIVNAIPDTIIPTRSLNVANGPVADAGLLVLHDSVTPLVVIGFVAWLWRRRDASLPIVVLYLAETLPFPYINERRVVLLLPLVVAWYAIGWQTVGRVVMVALARRRDVGWRPVAAVLPALLVVPALAAQLDRDYLYGFGVSSSQPRNSGYVAALQRVTPAGWSVATSYRWSISLFTGRTATNEVHFAGCAGAGTTAYAEQVHRALQRRHVAAVLTAALNRPGQVDSPCLQNLLSEVPWAVPVFHGQDLSTVFALVGPGTPRPHYPKEIP